MQDVLQQGGFSRAGYTGEHHEAPQRNIHRDMLEVVLACAFQHQARGFGIDPSRLDDVYLLAAAEVVGGEGFGVEEFGGIVIKDDLAALAAGAGADVQNTVGGEHHLRVVLDYYQGVTGVAQGVHHFDNAGHVARVQANAGLV